VTNFLRWAAGTLVLAAVVHFAVILAYPLTAMRGLMDAVEDEAGGPNLAIYPPRPDHTARRVVRPSPDLLYAICVYDVSEGPVFVRGPAVDTYWSLSLYAANSDNFYVTSRVPKGQRWGHVVLAEKGTDVAEIPYPVVAPPTKRGLAVYRMLVESGDRLAMLDTLRKRTGCAPYVK
jgi:uncharacterized membrane protein